MRATLAVVSTPLGALRKAMFELERDAPRSVAAGEGTAPR